MKLKNILIPAVTGTLTMTFFSYMASVIDDEDFSEPKLLSRIEERELNLPETVAPVAGWLSHLGVGVAWTTVYELYKKMWNENPSFADVMKFGVFGGLSAIGSWKLLFDALPARSANYYRKFYLQLFITHLIFFNTVAATRRVLNG